MCARKFFIYIRITSQTNAQLTGIASCMCHSSGVRGQGHTSPQVDPSYSRVAVFGFRVPCFMLISFIFFTVLNTCHIIPRFALFIQIQLFSPSVCVPHFSHTIRLKYFVYVVSVAC